MRRTTWLTTTRLEDRLSDNGRSPWGVRHAKREGASHTACGLPALNWKLFWHLPFSPTHGQACPNCRKAIVFIEATEKAGRATK